MRGEEARRCMQRNGVKRNGVRSVIYDLLQTQWVKTQWGHKRNGVRSVIYDLLQDLITCSNAFLSDASSFQVCSPSRDSCNALRLPTFRILASSVPVKPEAFLSMKAHRPLARAFILG